MSDDRMAMYEAQAIAVEQQLEIDRLKQEREEMAEGMRRLALQLGRTEKSQEGNNGDVLATINRLTEQVETLQAKMQEMDDRFNRLEEKVEEKSTIGLYEAVNGLRQQNIASENLLQRTRSYRIQIEQNISPMTILTLGGASVERIYDDMLLLKENTWGALSLTLPRRTETHGAVYLDGEIYIFGGDLINQFYKLEKNFKWTRLTDMNQTRYYIMNSCLVWDGLIWIFGGSSDSRGKKTLKSVECYDPKENKWIKMPAMHDARSDAAAVVWNGKVMICGGMCGESPLKSVETFDPESGVWTVLEDLHTPLYGHAIVPYRNRLILIGGWNGNTPINSVLVFRNVKVTHAKGTVEKLVWTKLSSMKSLRNSFSAVVLNDEIYVIGGWNGKERVFGTEIFNGTKWRDGPDLPYGSRYMSAIVIPQNFAESLLPYLL